MGQNVHFYLLGNQVSFIFINKCNYLLGICDIKSGFIYVITSLLQDKILICTFNLSNLSEDGVSSWTVLRCLYKYYVFTVLRLWNIIKLKIPAKTSVRTLYVIWFYLITFMYRLVILKKCSSKFVVLHVQILDHICGFMCPNACVLMLELILWVNRFLGAKAGLLWGPSTRPQGNSQKLNQWALSVLKTSVTCNDDEANMLENASAPRYRPIWVHMSGWHFWLLLYHQGQNAYCPSAFSSPTLHSGKALEPQGCDLYLTSAHLPQEPLLSAWEPSNFPLLLLSSLCCSSLGESWP